MLGVRCLRDAMRVSVSSFSIRLPDALVGAHSVPVGDGPLVGRGHTAVACATKPNGVPQR